MTELFPPDLLDSVNWTSKPGSFLGLHFTSWVYATKRLRQLGFDDASEVLLLGLIEAFEAEQQQQDGPAPKSYPFENMTTIRFTNFGKSSGVGLSFLYSVSRGEPLKASAVSFEIASRASAIMPSRRSVDEMMTAFRTLSGWRIAHYIATLPPML